VIDGSEAIASVATRISELACCYPTAPSTPMATVFQAVVADVTAAVTAIFSAARQVSAVLEVAT
jgi:pyruvate/2-oxoacid:ferredoxin oxidoreductase alpha subunit